MGGWDLHNQNYINGISAVPEKGGWELSFHRIWNNENAFQWEHRTQAMRFTNTLAVLSFERCVDKKTWEDLCEENGRLSGLTKKCWQLLPSVVRMHRRHSGYLFFDERGRIYRLRDEEIILWKDVALLSNVGWPHSVCLRLELQWPNVWWSFLHVLPTFGTYWCHMRRVYASSRWCVWAACVSTNWINWKVIFASPKKEAATATQKEVAARTGQFSIISKSSKFRGQTVPGWLGHGMCLWNEMSLPDQVFLSGQCGGWSEWHFVHRGLGRSKFQRRSFAANCHLQVSRGEWRRAFLPSLYLDALRVLPESFGALAGERFLRNHCDGCHHRNVWLVPSLSPQRRGR